MKHTATMILVLGSLIMALSGCKEPTTAENILKSDDGLFRGLELGDTEEMLVKLEGEPLKKEEGVYQYEYTIEEPETRDSKYDLTYKFHKDYGLIDIKLETRLQKDEDVKATFALLRDHFKAKLGDPSDENEEYVGWEYSNDKFKNINLHLHDKSREYKYGRVFLTVFIFQLDLNKGEDEEDVNIKLPEEKKSKYF